MEDSLKYGLPSGIVAFVLLWVFMGYELDINAIWRWLIVASGVHALVQWQMQIRNRAYYPFRMAFLSSFNVTFIMVITQAVLMFIFEAEIVGDTPKDVDSAKWLFYNIFIESMGLMFVALILSALTAFIFKRSK